jgi:hypothetical protein
VKKKLIAFDISILGDILEVPSDGFGHRTDVWAVDTKERLRFVGELKGNPKNRDSTINSGYLQPQHKILFWILHNNVVPMDGGRGSMSSEFLGLLHRMLNKEKISLPSLMIEHIITICRSQRSMHLAYGAFLTLVFKYFKVPIKSNEETLKSQNGFCLDARRLRKLNIGMESGQMINKLKPTAVTTSSIVPDPATASSSNSEPQDDSARLKRLEHNQQVLLNILNQVLKNQEDIKKTLEKLGQNHHSTNDDGLSDFELSEDDASD